MGSRGSRWYAVSSLRARSVQPKATAARLAPRRVRGTQTGKNFANGTPGGGGQLPAGLFEPREVGSLQGARESMHPLPTAHDVRDLPRRELCGNGRKRRRLSWWAKGFLGARGCAPMGRRDHGLHGGSLASWRQKLPEGQWASRRGGAKLLVHDDVHPLCMAVLALCV